MTTERGHVKGGPIREICLVQHVHGHFNVVDDDDAFSED